MAFDALVRFFFTDSGLSAGLAKANAALAQVGRSGPGARAGLRAAEQGMRALAFEAAGLGGPMGRISAGLLQLGGGSALVLGAVAGIGAVAGAYKLAAQSGDELRETNERLNQSWRDIIARGKPLVALQNEILKAQDDQTKAQEKLTELAARAAAPPGGTAGRLAQAVGLGVSGNELATAQANVDAAAARVTALQDTRPEIVKRAAREWVQTFLGGLKELGLDEQLAELTANRGQFESRGAEAAKAWQRAFMEIWTKAPAIGMPGGGALRAAIDAQGRPLGGRIGLPGGTAAGTGAVFGPAFEEFQRVETQAATLLRAVVTPQQEFNQAMDILRRSVVFATMTTKERKEAEDRLRESMGLTSKAAQAVAANMVTAFANLAAGLISGSGGGVGGFLQGVGGILGLIPGVSPLIGAGIGGLGTIIAASADRSANKIVAAIDRMAKEVGLERVTVVFTGPDGHEIRKTLSELEDSDGVVRVAGPAGANG